MKAIPQLGPRFLDYGLRATPRHGSRKDGSTQRRADKDLRTGPLSKLLDRIETFQVPHGSFEHFYVISVLSSLFWGFQIFSQGTSLKVICHAQKDDSRRSMSMDQIVLVWSLMTVQGVRRLFESYFVTKHSESRMWFVHWYMGVAFYLAMGVAIWIEGAGKCWSPYARCPRRKPC